MFHETTTHAKTRMKATLKKGLNVPIGGEPVQEVLAGPPVTRVAVMGDDYPGMKPRMLVQEGDQVRAGQTLFEDKKTPGVRFTSPAAGRVATIRRGAKRRFESIEVVVDGGESEAFTAYDDHHLGNLERDLAIKNLVDSGLWTAFRTRPYSKVPRPDTVPHAIFVTAIDTNPLAADPEVVLREPEYDRYFTQGLQVLRTLTDGTVYLCTAAGAEIPGKDSAGINLAEFDGPHPAGLAGTHIHLLAPASLDRTVWTIGYQDVVAVGHLFLTGTCLANRIVSVAGPAAAEPRLIRTCLGASLAELVGDTNGEPVRVISGSVLAGRTATAPTDFLGRYHLQVSILPEGNQRELLGWALPGFQKFSVTRAFASALQRVPESLPFTTSTEGSVRAIVPIGSYEKVMPLDILATPLLKALLVQDTDTAQALGCLELDEEDLGLCTFVCPGKNDYGPLLRKSLETIEHEG